MNDTTANKAVTEAQEAYKAMLEAHDAEVRHAVIAEVRASLDVFFAQLESSLMEQLDAVRAMREKLMDKPAATPAKRKRAKTVATDEQVAAVRAMFEIHETLTAQDIERGLNYGPRYIANACMQLEQQGWIKHEGNGWRWIPEQEAERENGLQTELDDGIDIETSTEDIE